MNGRLAKKLMKAARLILQEEGIEWGEGYNQYNQIQNCISWEPAYIDGDPHLPLKTIDVKEKVNGVTFISKKTIDPNAGRFRIRDPDGTPLIGPKRKAGTIFTAWKLRVVYQNLKRLWKQTNGRHEAFRNYM